MDKVKTVIVGRDRAERDGAVVAPAHEQDGHYFGRGVMGYLDWFNLTGIALKRGEIKSVVILEAA